LVHVQVTPRASGLAGHAFTDVTGNGLSADDVPQPGVTVRLYRDVNANSSYDSSTDTLVTSAVTGADGAYSFDGLAVDHAIVKEAAPAAPVRPTPLFTDWYAAEVPSTGNVTGLDFANFHRLPSDTLSSLYFVINGTTTVSDLTGRVHQGDQVEAVG